MTTGGQAEAALGDPIEILRMEWARQCKLQGGLVVLPHFPNSRPEHAASIVSGDIDALEIDLLGQFVRWARSLFVIRPVSLSELNLTNPEKKGQKAC
jgi:hypothetical protein